MNRSPIRTADRLLPAAAVISTVCLLSNMALLLLLRQDIFVHRRTVTGPEFIVLIAFLIVALFTFLSALWLAGRSLRQHPRRAAPRLALFGALCLIVMLAEKIMVDEIGREMGLGWETTGEWLILYGLLAIQLAYHLILIRSLRRESV